MARAEVIQFTDDLDGEPIDADDVVAIDFTVAGSAYTMDLRTSNAEQFEADMQPWIDRATWTGGRKQAVKLAEPTGATATITRSNVPAKKGGKKLTTGRPKEQTQAIRDWANSNGYSVSNRGRIPDEVVDAFDAVH